MGRWVLLKHTLEDESWHYDWMMEEGATPGAALIAFRVLERPDDPRIWEFMAERLDDHRPAYLDYEGEVSRGRGHVLRIAGGVCLVLRDDADEFRVQMMGTVNRQWIGTPRTARGYLFRAV